MVKALVSLGIPPKGRVGIFSSNRVEWTLLEWACFIGGFVVVPLYDTLGENAVEFIMHEAEVSVAFASGATLDVLAKALRKPEFEKIILCCFDEEKKSEKIKTWKELLDVGMKAPDVKLQEPENNDLAIIMYTSGTTGNPKGAMLTQNNLIAAASGAIAAIQADANDRHLSYLPLAHILETIVQTLCIACGASIAVFRGDIKGMVNDAEVGQPTMFIGVPRVFERIYSIVMV